jgi:hypothetical protein
MAHHYRYIRSKPYARFRKMLFRDVLAREDYVAFLARIRDRHHRPEADGRPRAKR